MSPKLCRVMTLSLEIGKLVVDLAQLVIVVIKALLGQSPNGLIGRPLLGGLRLERGMRVFLLLWLFSSSSLLTLRAQLVQSRGPWLGNGPLMRWSSLRRLITSIVGWRRSQSTRGPPMKRSPLGRSIARMGHNGRLVGIPCYYRITIDCYYYCRPCTIVISVWIYCFRVGASPTRLLVAEVGERFHCWSGLFFIVRKMFGVANRGVLGSHCHSHGSKLWNLDACLYWALYLARQFIVSKSPSTRLRRYLRIC